MHNIAGNKIIGKMASNDICLAPVGPNNCRRRSLNVINMVIVEFCNQTEKLVTLKIAFLLFVRWIIAPQTNVTARFGTNVKRNDKRQPESTTFPANFQCGVPWEEHFVITTCSLIGVCVVFFSVISFLVVAHTCSYVWRQNKMCQLKMGHKWSITNFHQCYCFVFKQSHFFSSFRKKKKKIIIFIYWIDRDA